MRISDWSSDVCSSDLATADALVARGVDRDRIAVTPNGLRQLPAPDERHVPAGPTVLAVGQLTARKRLDVLLEAAAALPDDVTTVLAGPDAGQGAELRAHADRLGLDGQIGSASCRERVCPYL